jgi:hypothetical protein
VACMLVFCPTRSLDASEPSVIIVQLKHGFGNQLFQYAAARRLSLTLGVPLTLDLSFYRTHRLRSYALNRLSIEADVATAWEMACWRGPRVLIPITHPLGLVPRLVRERAFTFDPSILELADGRCLDGYWQSYRYFEDVAPTIRREFAVKALPTDRDRQLLDRMERQDSICLHVRRGDYVSNPVVRKFHGFCSEDYYRRAVEQLAAQLQSPQLFVFSDDMPWVKQHLAFAMPTTHVEHHAADSAPEELRLMAGCRHFVISNSTLSWWAAWLASDRGGIMYAPRQWFADPSMNAADLLPPTWHRL